MVKKAMLWLAIAIGCIAYGVSGHPNPALAACSSGGTNAAATIEVVNQSTDSVDLYWVNYDCLEQYYQNIPPAGTISQQTYDGHEWVVRDITGAERARGFASASQVVQLVVVQQDQDGDGVSDSLDYCPAEVGTSVDGCPDGDGDGVADVFDECPTESAEGGCPPITTLSLPTHAPISTANINNLQELGFLRAGQYQLASQGPSTLLAMTMQGINKYDLSVPNLSPSTFARETLDPGILIMMAASDQAAVAATLTGNQIIIWDVATQTEKFRFTDDGFIYQLALSPDGTRLAVSYMTDGADLTGPQGAVHLLDTATGSVVWQLPTTEPSFGIRFNADGTQLAVLLLSPETPQVAILDAATGTELGRISDVSYAPFMADAQTFQFSPDGSTLAVLTTNGNITLWSIADFSLLADIPLPLTSRVMDFAFSPDSSLIVAVESSIYFSVPFPGETRVPDARLHLVDVANGTALTTVEMGRFEAREVLFTNDGTLILTLADSRLTFWGVPQ